MDKVQHFEIPADDLTRARKFYETVFNWQTIPFPMPNGMEYVGLHTGPVDEKNMCKEVNFINGGMFKRGGPLPITSPTIALVVADLDASIEKIKEAGGSVLMGKMDMAGMGWYAYVKDTEGNIIGVWQDAMKKS